jgi:hypothetical protein
MPGFMPGIHVFPGGGWKAVDGPDFTREDVALRLFPGHDE